MKWLALALLLASAFLFWENRSLEHELNSISQQSQQAQIEALRRAREQEAMLQSEFGRIEAVLSAQMDALNTEYTQAQAVVQQSARSHMGPSYGLISSGDCGFSSYCLPKPVRDSNASGERSTPTTSTPAVRAARAQSPQASKGASITTLRHLKRCQERLLYEAKEYDALAVHYNALLAIYEKATEINNDSQKQDH